MLWFRTQMFSVKFGHLEIHFKHLESFFLEQEFLSPVQNFW